jgi:spoIIIJ-associated protein
MQSIELTAKTVDDAKQQAASKLGVSAADVTVTVLEETKGLFGKSQVRVRCEARNNGKPEAKEPAIAKTPRTVKKAIQGTVDPEPVAEAPKAAEPKPRTRLGSRKEAAPKAEAAPAETPRPARGRAPKAEAPEQEETEGAAASQQDADKLIEILRDLLSAANLQVTAEARDMSGKYVNIQLDGRDAAFLVGKHGEVLNAMQYLLNIVSARRITAGVRATLDANDYRKRREDALTQLATKIAEQVLDRQEEAVLDALPAFERRIVHKALSTVSGIATYSEGEEPNRRVVIAPGE